MQSRTEAAVLGEGGFFHYPSMMCECAVQGTRVVAAAAYLDAIRIHVPLGFGCSPVPLEEPHERNVELRLRSIHSVISFLPALFA